MIVAELGPFQYGVVVLVSSFDLIWAFIGGVRWGNEVLGSLPMNCSQVFWVLDYGLDQLIDLFFTVPVDCESLYSKRMLWA